MLSSEDPIEPAQLQQVQKELTNLILSFDDLNFLLKDGLQDTVKQLLFRPTRGERLRGLIQSYNDLRTLLERHAGLARNLLFLFHKTDGARFRGFIQSFDNLKDLLRLCLEVDRPGIARDLLFHPADGARFRGFIQSFDNLKDLLRLCPGLARDLLFHPADGASFRWLIRTLGDLMNLLRLCPDLARDLLFHDTDGGKFQEFIKGHSNVEALTNLKTLIGLCPDITASLVRQSLVINLEDFFQKNPSPATNFEILGKLIDLSFTYQNSAEMDASTLFSLPELNNPDSLSTLAHAIVLTEFPVFQESQRSALQATEQKQEQEKLRVLTQIKIENLLTAARLLIAKISFLDGIEKTTPQNNILTLMKVWLRHIQQVLLARKEFYERVSSDVALDSPEEIFKQTETLPGIAVDSVDSKEIFNQTIKNIELILSESPMFPAIVISPKDTALQSSASQTNGTPTSAPALTTTPFSDTENQDEDSSSAPDCHKMTP